MAVVKAVAAAQVLPQPEPALLAHLLLALLRLVPLPHKPAVLSLPSLSVQGLVASEVHLLSRQSFSAATARISRSSEKPTCEPVPSSRWPPQGRPCPSA